MAEKWMIYGANGYTGRLIADLACARGMKPVLAGRNAQSIFELSRSTGLPGDVFDLSDKNRLTRRFKDCSLVLNAAGPFSQTASKILDICLQTKTHYLDITGEIDVFESIFRRHQEVLSAGILALPGVGFDVVPTDTLAAQLKKQLPDAVKLTLAFKASNGRPSPGTAKTMLLAAGKGGRVRRDGHIVGVPTDFRTTMVPFAEGTAIAVSIPWGDISTAYRTTGIPNIEVLMATTESDLERMQRLEAWGWLFSLPGVKHLLHRHIVRTFPGPREADRLTGRMSLWAQVENTNGEKVHLTMETPEGYTFTANAAVMAVERILKDTPQAGSYTPVQALGTDFCFQLPGVKVTQHTKALA